MPVVYLTKSKKREETVTKIIKKALTDQDTNQRALAKELGMKYGTLHKRINSPETCRLEELWQILDALCVPEEIRAKMLI